MMDKKKLNVQPNPSNAVIEGNVSYGTMNSKIAVVSSKGVVTALAPGSCYVWAKTENGLKVRCRVTIRKPKTKKEYFDVLKKYIKCKYTKKLKLSISKKNKYGYTDKVSAKITKDGGEIIFKYFFSVQQSSYYADFQKENIEIYIPNEDITKAIITVKFSRNGNYCNLTKTVKLSQIKKGRKINYKILRNTFRNQDSEIVSIANDEILKFAMPTWKNILKKHYMGGTKQLGFGM